MEELLNIDFNEHEVEMFTTEELAKSNTNTDPSVFSCYEICLGPTHYSA